MTEKVVQLHTVAPVAIPDGEAFRQWAHQWVDHIFDGGVPDTVIVLVERSDGSLSKVSQSVHRLDTSRLVGLMQICTQRAADDRLPTP